MITHIDLYTYAVVHHGVNAVSSPKYCGNILYALKWRHNTVRTYGANWITSAGFHSAPPESQYWNWMWILHPRRSRIKSRRRHGRKHFRINIDTLLSCWIFLYVLFSLLTFRRLGRHWNLSEVFGFPSPLPLLLPFQRGNLLLIQYIRFPFSIFFREGGTEQVATRHNKTSDRLPPQSHLFSRLIHWNENETDVPVKKLKVSKVFVSLTSKIGPSMRKVLNSESGRNEKGGEIAGGEGGNKDTVLSRVVRTWCRKYCYEFNKHQIWPHYCWCREDVAVAKCHTFILLKHDGVC